MTRSMAGRSIAAPATLGTERYLPAWDSEALSSERALLRAINDPVPQGCAATRAVTAAESWRHSPTVNLRLEPPLLAAGSGQASTGGHCSAAR